MEMREGDDNFFTVCGGSITLEAGGAYHAALTVDVPPDNIVDSILAIELDGYPLTPPGLTVTADTTDGSTANYAANCIFHAEAGSVLRLTASDPISINAATAQPVFTLVLMKL